MKVILLDELRGKGGEGDVVDVAQGYAENFLFPKRIAIAATPGNIKQLEERRNNIAQREERRIAEAQATKAALDGKSVTIDAKVGEEGQLFGSVTSTMIEEAVKAQLGIELDRKRIERSAAIKTAGTHEVTVNLYREINAVLTIVVADPERPVAPAEEAAPEEPAAEEEVVEVVEAEVIDAEGDAVAEVVEVTETEVNEVE